jgi:methyl-accepting chemotaxis protein
MQQVSGGTSTTAESLHEQLEMTGKTESIIAEATGLSKEIQNLSETANEKIVLGTKLVEQLSESAEKSSDNSRKVIREMVTLNSKTEEAMDITSIINGIATQTNLLALNASIEAARAGEQGRGFAVVASQISKLAEQSNESARQIEAIIDSLITDSAKSVETMDEVQKIMEEQSEKVGQTVEMFNQVKEGIDTSITGIANIAEKTKKLDDARVNVVDVVQNLTAIAEENAASTEETSASVTEVTNIVYNISKDANDLDEIAIKLQEQIRLFTS